MTKTLPSLLVALGLACFALAARAEDPPENGDEPKDEAATPAGAIGGSGGATGGAGISTGSKDKAPKGGGSSASKPAPTPGGGIVPPNEALAGLGKEDDSCKGLPPQTYTTMVKQSKILDGKLLTKSADDIDLHKVIFVKGASIADWAQTSTLKDIKVGGGSICIDHTFLGSGKWNAEFFGSKETLVEGNQWIFAFIKGRWYGGAGEWIRPAQLCKSVDAPNVGCGVFYDSEPLKSWRPAHGELVGVAVSAPARAGQWSKAERSNVRVVPWP